MLIAKRSQKQFAAQWERTGTLNGHVEEMHTGHAIVKVVRAPAGGDRRVRRGERARSTRPAYKAQFISGHHPARDELHRATSTTSRSRVIGGVRVASGTMSLGDVQAFIQYSRQFTHADHPDGQHRQRAPVGGRVGRARLRAARRARGDADPAAPAVLATAAGRVALEDVSFRYVPDEPLIDDLNLVADAGPDGRHRRPDRRRQDDPGQPAHALLRDRRRADHGRRHRHPRHDPRQPARDVRDGPPGHLAVRRHDPREHRLRPRGRDRGGDRRPRPRPPTWTTSSGRCPTATTR